MNKFETLLENTRARYTMSGLLVGDLVKVKITSFNQNNLFGFYNSTEKAA